MLKAVIRKANASPREESKITWARNSFIHIMNYQTRTPRFQESCHPCDQYTRGLEDMTNASLQRGR